MRLLSHAIATCDNDAPMDTPFANAMLTHPQ